MACQHTSGLFAEDADACTRGMMRWHIMYNLVVLRLISFGMDLHWARRAAEVGKQPPLTPPQQPSADQPSMKVQQPKQNAAALQAAAVCTHVCFG